MVMSEYLTPGQIRQRLVHRRAGRGLAEWHAEVERLTGMAISPSHLSNIEAGRKQPNDVVMKYLGGQRIEGETVYQIAAGRKVKRR